MPYTNVSLEYSTPSTQAESGEPTGSGAPAESRATPQKLCGGGGAAVTEGWRPAKARAKTNPATAKAATRFFITATRTLPTRGRPPIALRHLTFDVRTCENRFRRRLRGAGRRPRLSPGWPGRGPRAGLAPARGARGTGRGRTGAWARAGRRTS